MRRNIWFKFSYRLVFLIVSITGIILHFITPATIKTNSMLNFFTVQSNIWVAVVGLILFILTLIELVTKKNHVGRPLIIIKFVFTVSIMMTFCTYNFILLPFANRLDGYVFFEISNIIVHIVTPLLFLGDFLLFDRVEKLSYKNCLWGIIPPLAYFTYSMVNAGSGVRFVSSIGTSRYPYFFMDVDMFGWFGSEMGMGVTYWIALMTSLTVLFGIIFIWIYNIVSKSQFKKEKLESNKKIKVNP